MTCLPTWRGRGALRDDRPRAELLDVREEIMHGQLVRVHRYTPGISGTRPGHIPDGVIRAAHDAQIRHRRTTYEPTRELCYDGLPHQASVDYVPGGERG